MRKLRYFFLKYKPVFVGLFIIYFFVSQGYLLYLKNHNEPTETPRCDHLHFVYLATTKDKLSVKVNFTIDYNKNSWFWGLFNSERKVRNEIIGVFNETVRDYPINEFIETIGETQQQVLMRSLYQVEQQCSVDIYKTDINICLSTEAMNRYIEIKEADKAAKNNCLKKHGF